MTALLKVGFFFQAHKGRIPRALVESRGLLPEELRSSVANYLRSGTLLATSPAITRDLFDPSRILGGKEYFTDGVWLWPGDYVYYVEKYGVVVPQEFLAHMEAHGWSARPLSEEDLRVAEDGFTEAGFPSGDEPPKRSPE